MEEQQRQFSFLGLFSNRRLKGWSWLKNRGGQDSGLEGETVYLAGQDDFDCSDVKEIPAQACLGGDNFMP